MKKIKLIVGIMGFFCVVGFSFGAKLRIIPGEGALGMGCIESFDIYMDLENGEETLASDIILDSNMEFINFENRGIFHSYMPPRELGNEIHLVLLNTNGGNVVSGGKLGTIYYKVLSDDDQYIRFVYNGFGLGGDCNVSIDGYDILDGVYGGLYKVDNQLKCDEYTGDVYLGNYEEDLNNIVSELSHFANKNKYKKFFNIKSFAVLGGFLIIILLFVFVKKGKKN